MDPESPVRRRLDGVYQVKLTIPSSGGVWQQRSATGSERVLEVSVELVLSSES